MTWAGRDDAGPPQTAGKRLRRKGREHDTRPLTWWVRGTVLSPTAQPVSRSSSEINSRTSGFERRPLRSTPIGDAASDARIAMSQMASWWWLAIIICRHRQSAVVPLTLPGVYATYCSLHALHRCRRWGEVPACAGPFPATPLRTWPSARQVNWTAAKSRSGCLRCPSPTPTARPRGSFADPMFVHPFHPSNPIFFRLPPPPPSSLH